MLNNKIATMKLKVWQPWLVVMSASLLFFYSFMQLNILNPIGSSLMRDFSINTTQLGTLSAMYFYANFILVFPAGLLLDRLSTKKLILFAMFAAVISMFGFALAPNVILAGIARFVSGIGGAFCFLSCVRLASRWFEPKKLAFVIGCIVTMCMLGGMVAQTPMALLSRYFGWREAMMFFGIAGILFTGIIWIFVKNEPETIEEKSDITVNIEKIPFWQSIKMVVLNRYNWLGGLYTALMNLPIFLLGALWGNLYLSQVDHLSRPNASEVISMLFLGAIFGSPLAGWISDKLTRRRLPMMAAALLSLAITLIVIYVPTLNMYTLIILFFILGVIIGAQSLSYAVVTELNSPSVTGSANSIISMTLMASGFIFQPLFGWLINLSGDSQIINGATVYTPHDFRLAMLILPATFIISFIVAALLKETRCRAQY